MRRNKGRRYSFTDHKTSRYRKRWIVLSVFIIFLFYICFTSLVFSMRVMENDTMAPNLRSGERFIFSSYTVYSIIPGLDLEKEPFPFQRGDVVLVDTYSGEKPGFFGTALDGLVRFFTAQRISIANHREYEFVKRVVGLPGDEVSMSNYVVRVKAKGSIYSLTEFEVTDRDYTPDIPQMPNLWDSSMPFSGTMNRIVLGENECFVLSDDRGNTNDSRTWGPIPIKSLNGKALFRYWPFNRLGRP